MTGQRGGLEQGDVMRRGGATRRGGETKGVGATRQVGAMRWGGATATRQVGAMRWGGVGATKVCREVCTTHGGEVAAGKVSSRQPKTVRLLPLPAPPLQNFHSK